MHTQNCGATQRLYKLSSVHIRKPNRWVLRAPRPPRSSSWCSLGSWARRFRIQACQSLAKRWRLPQSLGRSHELTGLHGEDDKAGGQDPGCVVPLPEGTAVVAAPPEDREALALSMLLSLHTPTWKWCHSRWRWSGHLRRRGSCSGRPWSRRWRNLTMAK